MVFEVVIGRSKKDVAKYGLEGTVFLGKQYVKMGQTTSLSNPVYMDVAGAHVVFIVGKRGSGKCLHGDTLIPLSDGRVRKIKDLKDDSNSIFTLNSSFKVISCEKSEFYERKVNKMIRLQLRPGKWLFLTPEHPLLTVKGWVPAEELHLGSRIATPRKIDVFGDKAMRECEVKLLAYLITEGHLSNGFVLFSNIDHLIIEDFKQSIFSFDSGLKVDLHSKAGCYRVSQVQKKMENPERDNKGKFLSGPHFSQSSLRQWLESISLYGHLSHTKFIPDCIFTLPRHQLSLFLNRLFSCDGTIYQKAGHWFVSYCSSSDQLIS